MIKVDDLKCCGNCQYYNVDISRCEFWDMRYSACHTCIKWEYDKFNFKERLEND